LPASYAHAGVSPQLGVDGTPVRSDVKRPSNKQPCGSGVDIASALDTSTAVLADQNGNVNVTVLNFNPGGDGSRKVSAKVDPTGTGKTFVKMTVTVNGDPAPKNTGSQQVIAALPAGTKCTGGADKNKCLAQFVMTSGFGNCVVVSQTPDAGATTSTSPDAGVATLDVGLDISARAEEDTDVLAKKKKKNGNKKKKGGKNSGKDKVAAKKSGQKADEAKKASGKKVQKKKKGKKAEGGKASKDKSKVAAKSGKGKKDKKKQKKGGNKKQAGTRAARALLADLE